MDKIHYGAFQELFKHLGINPYEFRELCKDKVEGHFPNLPDRTALVQPKELVDVIWKEKKSNKGFFGIRRK